MESIRDVRELRNLGVSIESPTIGVAIRRSYFFSRFHLSPGPDLKPYKTRFNLYFPHKMPKNPDKSVVNQFHFYCDL